MATPHLQFDKNGNLEVFDSDGKKVTPHKGPLPKIPGKFELEKIDTITAYRFKGSCRLCFFWNGGWHCVDC